jgi:hypothetical protein
MMSRGKRNRASVHSGRARILHVPTPPDRFQDELAGALRTVRALLATTTELRDRLAAVAEPLFQRRAHDQIPPDSPEWERWSRWHELYGIIALLAEDMGQRLAVLAFRAADEDYELEVRDPEEGGEG